MNVFDIPERFMTHPYIISLQKTALFYDQPIQNRLNELKFLKKTQNKFEYLIEPHKIYLPWNKLTYRHTDNHNMKIKLVKDPTANLFD